MSRRLAAALIGVGFGLLQVPAAAAAPTADFCRVFGATLPPYPLPLPPVSPEFPSLPLAIPQVPVRVTVAGQELPICAVYMSINDSRKLATTVIDEMGDMNPGLNLLLPSPVPDDLLFPDLRAQPWFTAPGGSFAQAVAAALVANGYWKTTDSISHPWADEGKGFLVNANPSVQPNDSTYSAYFLWRAMDEHGNPDGKARVLWYNTVTNVNGDRSINWQARDEPNLDPDTKFWFWVLDPLGSETAAPGPTPLLGAAAAFRWSRRLRRRLAGRPRPR